MFDLGNFYWTFLVTETFAGCSTSRSFEDTLSPFVHSAHFCTFGRRPNSPPPRPMLDYRDAAPHTLPLMPSKFIKCILFLAESFPLLSQPRKANRRQSEFTSTFPCFVHPFAMRASFLHYLGLAGEEFGLLSPNCKSECKFVDALAR